MSKHDNDIDQNNDGSQGYAHAGTNPQEFQFRKKRPSNYGMHGPNRTRFTPFGITASTVSKLALPDNRWRNYLMVQNQSTADIFIGFGVHVGDNGESGFLLASNGFYEVDTNIPFNSIYIRGNAASQQVLIIEGTIDKAQK